jgi:RNA polymerase sigma-70 factor (ECF subfamily)
MTPLHDVYQRHAIDVYRYALLLSGDRAEAEDITADAFVRLWTAPGEIRLGTVKAYLFTIARHLYLDRQRAQARLTTLDPALPSKAPTAEDEAAVRAEVAQVRAAIRHLPEADRTALLMRASGVSYDEIARALQTSVGAIKVRVHRARKRLLEARQPQETRS